MGVIIQQKFHSEIGNSRAEIVRRPYVFIYEKVLSGEFQKYPANKVCEIYHRHDIELISSPPHFCKKRKNMNLCFYNTYIINMYYANRIRGRLILTGKIMTKIRKREMLNF
jgi:hypothetical protein